MVVAKQDVVAAKIHYIPVVTLVTIEGGSRFQQTVTMVPAKKKLDVAFF